MANIERADPELVPEGIHEAKLAGVRRFTNAFGDRVGLVFEITTGPHQGIELMEAAALKASPRGKLAELLRGMGGADGSLLKAHELVGKPCRIAVRHEATKAGAPYAAVARTFK
jgi:hypothetical protein